MNDYKNNLGRKLVIVADSDPRTKVVGGIGIYSLQLAKRLGKAFDVMFIGKKQKIQKMSKVDYKVILANDKPEQNNVSFMLSLFKTSKSIVTSSNDVIHAQRADFLAPFSAKKGKKFITLHGSHYKNMRLKKGFLLRSLYTFLERRGLKAADGIFAVDSRTLSEYKGRYPEFSHKMSVMPIGIDTTKFAAKSKASMRKKLGYAAKQTIFLFVGRLEKEKQVHLMIKHLKKNEKLLVVGNGREEDKLRELAKDKDVEFLGPKSQDELVEFYSVCDALLLFSTHEGLPTVVLEALSCQRPIVATKVGELPNLINEDIGYLFDKNPRKFMDSIVKRKDKMAKACRKKALEYDWKALAKKMQKVYS